MSLQSTFKLDHICAVDASPELRLPSPSNRPVGSRKLLGSWVVLHLIADYKECELQILLVAFPQSKQPMQKRTIRPACTIGMWGSPYPARFFNCLGELSGAQRLADV